MQINIWVKTNKKSKNTERKGKWVWNAYSLKWICSPSFSFPLPWDRRSRSSLPSSSDGLKPQGINLVPFSATIVAITKSEKEEDEFVEIQTVLQNIYVHSFVQNCNYKAIPLEFFFKTKANLRLIVKLVVFDSFKLIFPNFSQRLSRVFWPQ